eukprot:TRINITY_DN8920_c0_g1_i1.p1 TRINITY_DN8920_c0_g1~~TRINITY_DN8920_c0_g1_i1.p1  ORF type:complete len:138 (-),score=22.03 TRINITY_DN8920_c0_g1_i1:11-424(-)
MCIRDRPLIYYRSLREDLPSFVDRKVAIVGRVVKVSNNRLILETSSQKTLLVANFTGDSSSFDNQTYLEIRGTVTENQTIVMDDYNIFGDSTFDLDLFNKTLEMCRKEEFKYLFYCCLLYTSPSPRDRQKSRMPSSA